MARQTDATEEATRPKAGHTDDGEPEFDHRDPVRPIALDELPRSIRTIEHVWIPMPDGVRLSATIWLPRDAQDHPVPAILEYIPYRKRDGTVTRDTMTHPYVAAHGYACVRVDIRGSGDSEGVLTDEYTQRELDDGVAILEWLEAQPWCDGNCGMIGISWGGFNGLQIAAMQPRQLKAVISLCSTDDRYADDVHYMGGCLLGDNLSWASVMFGYITQPPDPRVVGDAWRDMWMQRLEAARPWLIEWLEHQHRGEYWKHGSICEDYANVQVPVMAVSGWADAYSNAVFRLMKNLPEGVPRQGLVGPWSHKYPHFGLPGPAIDFLNECLRWWDRYLKGRQTGIEHEPTMRAYLQESTAPDTGHAFRPGRWVGEPSWPSPNVSLRPVPLASGAPGLKLNPDLTVDEGDERREGERSICSPVSHGYFGGKWCSEAAPPDLPDDQREEDGGAIIFETPPLDEPLDLLGPPIADLTIRVDQPVAMAAVRLGDVLPDGRVTRVSFGLLNLNHRDDHEHPKPLEPGRAYRLPIRMRDVGHTVLAGHRLRLSISSSYWPLAWLPPHRATISVDIGKSHLLLPVRHAPADDTTVAFDRPVVAEPIRAEQVESTEHSWKVVRDLAAGTSELQVRKGSGSVYWPHIDMNRTSVASERYFVDHDNIHSARGEVRWTHSFSRGPWDCRCETRTVLTSDADAFYVRADLDAYEGDARVFCRTWRERIERKMV